MDYLDVLVELCDNNSIWVVLTNENGDFNMKCYLGYKHTVVDLAPNPTASPVTWS